MFLLLLTPFPSNKQPNKQLVGSEEENLSKAKNKFITLTMSNFILIWRSLFDFPAFLFSIVLILQLMGAIHLF